MLPAAIAGLTVDAEHGITVRYAMRWLEDSTAASAAFAGGGLDLPAPR